MVIADPMVFAGILNAREIASLADPSNVMLKIGSDSLLLDPKRRLFRAFPSGGGAPAGGFKPYWIPQRNRTIGATL